MYYAIAVFVGVLLGVFLSRILVKRSRYGILKVYIPDEQDEQPYLYVELTKPVDSICEQKQVLFTVNVRNLKTQK